MRNDQSLVFSDIVLHKNLYFIISKKAYEKISVEGYDPISFLKEFSKKGKLILYKHNGRMGEDCIKIYTPKGSLLLAYNNDGVGFLATDYNGYSVYSERDAFSKGKTISFAGIAIEIRLTDYSIYTVIYNGHEYSTDAGKRFIQESVEKSSILKLVDIQDTREQKRKLREENAELNRILDIAESYSNLEADCERERIDQLGLINYSGLETIDDWVRLDRIAYRCSVQKKFEKELSQGTSVEILNNDGLPLKAEVSRIKKDGDELLIDLLFSENTEIDDIPDMGYISLVLNSVNQRVQKKAIDSIRDGSAKSKYLQNVLGSYKTGGFIEHDLKDVKDSLIAQKKNDSQINAVINGINSKDIFLVMGPPGTGKTTVIVEWVKYFVRNNKRVLISSQNNKAVDNVIERLGEENDIDILRIGSEMRISENVAKFRFENKIAEIRDSIDAAVKVRKIEYEQSIKSWLKYLKNLKTEHYPLVQEFDNAKKLAVKVASHQLVPLVHELNELSTMLDKTNNKLQSIENQLNEMEGKSPGEGIAGILSALLFKIKRPFFKRKIAKLTTQKSSQLLTKRNTIEKYNKVYEEYTMISDKFKSTIIEGLYRQMLKIKKNCSNKALFDKPDPDSYGLFSVVNQTTPNPYSIDSWNDYLNKAESAIDCAKGVYDSVTKWHEDISEQQNYALQELILGNVDLVGATCIGAQSQSRFNSIDFDVTIIDEAGQIQIHNTLVPMSVSEKVIMLGDHKQIPPNADQNLLRLCEENEIDSSLLEMSLFEHLYNKLPEENKMILDTQYRMPAEMADIISKWFYDGKYKSPDFKRNLPPFLPEISDKNLILIDTSKEKKRSETSDKGSGTYNELEAEVIRNLMKRLSEVDRLKTEEVGIISAYKLQVRQISKVLKGLYTPEQIRGMAATLDSFQGQERDLIVYSFTRSAAYKKENQQRIGFLNELRRLNVAITRCKKTLIMIGDFEFLSSCNYAKKDDEGNKIYKRSEKEFSDFIELLTSSVKSGDGEFISVKDLYDRLGVNR